ncbi:CTP-dependent diacylglycerol kinase 1 [Leucoagaricus sp. SymC.cos]|nr:CTP-dependent diacylglycerol kinase 1 [Leucoagaricus sp. SymC.cos]
MSLSSPRHHRRRTSSSSTSTRRSHSPIVVFSTPPSSGDVHTITRKVIRRLEGLGHLEMLDVCATAAPTSEDIDTDDVPSSNVSDGERERDSEPDAEERAQVEKVLCNELVNQSTNGHTNGRSISAAAAVNGVEKPIAKQKVDWEIPRKLLHSSIGFFALYLYVTESDVSKVIFVLWSSLCIIVPADLLRFHSPAFEKMYERFLGFLMRESEKNSANGVIWYILGVNFALQFYPRDVATVAILILSWADTAASTIGRLYGPSSPRLPSHIPLLPFLGLKIPLAQRKSWAGFIAASLTGALIAVGFWSCIAPVRFGGAEVSWDFVKGVVIGSSEMVGGGGSEGEVLKGWIGLSVLSVVTGLVSGVAEAMDLGSLDDNLTLPIISGGCILGFLKFLGWIGSFWTS